MTNALARRRGGRGLYKKGAAAQRRSDHKRRTLPEYLIQSDIDELLRAAPHHGARLLMLIQWRAGLRISEALSLTMADINLDDDPPTLRVLGKGSKERIVPVHPELQAALRYIPPSLGPVLGHVHRGTAWRWIKEAARRAPDLAGKRITTHTLRHSAARHWLANRVQINVVQ